MSVASDTLPINSPQRCTIEIVITTYKSGSMNLQGFPTLNIPQIRPVLMNYPTPTPQKTPSFPHPSTPEMLQSNELPNYPMYQSVNFTTGKTTLFAKKRPVLRRFCIDLACFFLLNVNDKRPAEADLISVRKPIGKSRLTSPDKIPQSTPATPPETSPATPPPPQSQPTQSLSRDAP